MKGSRLGGGRNAAIFLHPHCRRRRLNWMRGRILHPTEHEVQRSPGQGWSRLWTFRTCPLRGARCEAGANARVVRNLRLEPECGNAWLVFNGSPQAKLMGGGSSINGGTALGGTQADSDEWVAMGNDALVYRSLENDPVRGTRGPHPTIRASEHEIGKIQKSFLTVRTRLASHLRSQCIRC
jgi:hypothetical protein